MVDLNTISQTQPLKVLQIASGDLWAGAEVQLLTLCEQLQQCDEVEPAVVLLNEGELANRLRAVGVEVTVFDESAQSFWQILASLKQFCERIRPDIIHSHRQKENVLAGLCGLCTGIPSIRTVHGASEFQFQWFSAKYLVARIDRLVGRFLQRRIVAVSDDLRQKLSKQYPSSHLELVCNGVNLDDDEPCEPAAMEEGVVHIGIVGRLVAVKRVDIFIEMAAALLLSGEEGRRYKFWIIGDGPLRNQHEALASRLGIMSSVKFVGHVPSARPYLQALDLLVMCSDHEGTPMTLLEAFKYKLPTVTHDVGGLHELLGGGECGYLVEKHCPIAYASAVEEVLHPEGDLVQKYIMNGTQRLEEHYNAEKNKNAYIETYRSVIQVKN